MEAIYRLVRRVPSVVELFVGILLLCATWFLMNTLFLAALVLWYAIEAGSRGLKLRMWAMLFAAAVLVIYATGKISMPPDFHPSIPA
jgi:hypothetical protein